MIHDYKLLIHGRRLLYARYESAKPSVQAIVDDKNAKTSNKKRARSLLGLSEEEENKSAASESVSGSDAK